MRGELHIAAQKGVITARRLEALGVPSQVITRRVKSGLLHRKYRGVYAVGRPDLTIEGEMWAAALAVGEDAVVSHLGAAYLWGFWTKQPTPPFDVTVPRRVRPREDIRVHCVGALGPRERTWWRGVPVTRPARTVVDLDSVLRSDSALARAVHEAEAQRRVSPDQIREQLARTPCQRVERIIAPGPRPTRSELEDAIDAMLTRHDLRPPMTNVRVAGVEVDFFYPEQGLVIEADGAQYHDTEIRRRQDRRKQAILEAHGLRVLRLRKEDTLPSAEAQTIARVRLALR